MPYFRVLPHKKRRGDWMRNKFRATCLSQPVGVQYVEQHAIARGASKLCNKRVHVTRATCTPRSAWRKASENLPRSTEERYKSGDEHIGTHGDSHRPRRSHPVYTSFIATTVSRFPIIRRCAGGMMTSVHVDQLQNFPTQT